MNTGQISKWLRGYLPKGRGTPPETRVKREVDISRMTLGEYQDFIERIEKIRNLDNHPHTICQHIRIMREAIEIVTGHEEKADG